ncbi:MAG: tetratricopeptide repeat protein, partial [Pseudomonadota bacterium]
RTRELRTERASAGRDAGKICFRGSSGILAAIMLAFTVAACSHASPDREAAIGATATPGDKDIRLASRHYKDGSFGNAAKHFKLAVEKEPKNPDAWMGLAASYDRLRRFDLADRSYGRARKLSGDTAELMNNIGYSHLLRGDLLRARQFMLAAYQRSNTDPRIISNIETLNEMLAKAGKTPIPI